MLDAIASQTVDLVINNAAGPREANIRRAAVEAGVLSLTSLDTARTLAEAMESTAGPPRSLQAYQACLVTGVSAGVLSS